MNIIEALTEHNTIAREVWPAGEYVLVTGNTLAHVTPGRREFTGWNPSLSDTLADDWHPVA